MNIKRELLDLIGEIDESSLSEKDLIALIGGVVFRLRNENARLMENAISANKREHNTREELDKLWNDIRSDPTLLCGKEYYFSSDGMDLAVLIDKGKVDVLSCHKGYNVRLAQVSPEDWRKRFITSKL